MARFQITGPDGNTYEINAPEGASEAEVMGYVQREAAKAQPDVSQAESLGRGALQGATFGFSDEIYGGAKGLYDKFLGSGDFSGTYAKERDAVRAANDRAQEANPTSYFAGEIGGGVALPLGAVKAGYRGAQAANAGLAARSAAAAKEGAAYGAAYGFGTGEGDAMSQVRSTAGGAAGGAIFGGALPGAIQLVGAAARVPAQAARVASNPRGVAAEKMAESFARDAGRETLRASDPLARAANAMATSGDNALMLADMGGENTRNLVRAAVNMPNARAERFNQVLNRRQMTQPANLENALSKELGAGDDFYKNIDDLVTKRDALAAPMFKAAFLTDTPMTPALKSVLSRPTMQELDKQVSRRMMDEGIDGSNVKITEWLHRMKLELDEQIGMSKQAEKMGNRPTQGWDTRTLTVLKSDLLKAIDNKPYKYALQKYAGPSSLKRAAEEGFDEALKEAPEKLSQKLSTLSASEQDMWRMGAARALIDKVRQGNFMRDRTKSIFDTPDMQKRLKEVFPSDKARGQFLRVVANERKKSITRQAAQGNSTTAKQLTNAQEAGKAARTVADVAGAVSGKPGALISMLERGVNYASGITPGVAAEILNLAMAQGGAKARVSSTRAIQDAFARGHARKARQGLLTDALLPAPGVLSAEYSSSGQR